jgi:hypothetical protein
MSNELIQKLLLVAGIAWFFRLFVAAASLLVRGTKKKHL